MAREVGRKSKREQCHKIQQEKCLKERVVTTVRYDWGASEAKAKHRSIEFIEKIVGDFSKSFIGWMMETEVIANVIIKVIIKVIIN